jgi:hypothetical protein
MTALAAWQNYYVIVGSSAGALIGLQFVVITLIAGMPSSTGTAQAGATFSTPNILHFGAVLLLAGIQTAPWHGTAGFATLWGVMGISGVIYEIAIARRMRAQNVYKPVFEDWLFHAFLPLLAYATLGVSAIAAGPYLHGALFAVSAAAMLLLFTGIHNAWDAVTYHIFVKKPQRQAAQSTDQK